jgi:hypothetical protein
MLTRYEFSRTRIDAHSGPLDRGELASVGAQLAGTVATYH